MELIKLTTVYENEHRETTKLSNLNIKDLFARIQDPSRSKEVQTLRDVYPILTHGLAYYDRLHKLPIVYTAAQYTRTRQGALSMKSYHGLVQLEVDGLTHAADVAKVKREAASLPQTLAAMEGVDGHSVFIWIRFLRPDQTLPTDEEEAAHFHAHAYRTAVTAYQPVLSAVIAEVSPLLTQSMRMTFDPAPYFQPEATPFLLSQPDAMPDTKPMAPAVSPSETTKDWAYLYELARSKALDELLNDYRKKSDRPFTDLTEEERADLLLPRLTRQCFFSGIPEEEALSRALRTYYHYPSEETLRILFRNTYKEKEGFGTKQSSGSERDIILRLKEFLNRRYEFRFNSIRQVVEYRMRHSYDFEFHLMSDRDLNTFIVEAQLEGIRVWDRDVVRVLRSNFVPLYNPVEDYLDHLPVWDGVDRIRELARRIPSPNTDLPDFFHRWFLGMVATWQGVDPTHGPSTVILLQGKQGCRKSTFCLNLLPKELRFGYTDSLDYTQKKDAQRALSNYLLICLDEYDQTSVTQQAYLKHLLQKPFVKMRKSHDVIIEESRRYASFIATTNRRDILTDLTGNRRFFCVPVEGLIDVTSPIPYDQLYAQAVAEIAAGERYWFNDEEEAAIEHNNREFELQSPIEQIFLTYLAPVNENEDGEWKTATEIFNYLQTKVKDRLRISSIILFGRILRKHCKAIRNSNRGVLYHVTPVE